MKCFAPMMIKNPAFSGGFSRNVDSDKQDRMIPVRCGTCEGCLKSKINDWAFRLEQEAKVNLYVQFVTLTYDPAFVPLTSSLLPTIQKRDVQLYFKRLRKLCSGPVKYFAVGEYGTKSYRPHYHLILFGVDSAEKIREAWANDSGPLGNVHIGNDITGGAVPYTLKYMYKKGLIPAFPEDDRVPEFRLMSKKLGINYLTPEMIAWHLADFKNRQYAIFNNGIPIALPRYFRDRLLKLWKGDPETLRNEHSVFMTSDDRDYRTLKSRVEGIKSRQKVFDKKRNQETRNKL